MSYQIPFSNSKLDKAMTSDQFNQVVEAILAGKYSWACVLILRSAGYNPLHYIPYRTYNRLLKDNCQLGSRKVNGSTSNSIEPTVKANTEDLTAQRSSRKITDLSYLETINGRGTNVHGGTGNSWVLDVELESGLLSV